MLKKNIFLWFVFSLGCRTAIVKNPNETNMVSQTSSSCQGEEVWDSSSQRCFTAKAFCLLHGSIWDGKACLTKEKVCENKGKDWKWQEGTGCLKAEEVCLNGGNIWDQGRCWNPQEICEKKGLGFVWDKSACQPISFQEICSHPPSVNLEKSLEFVFQATETTSCKELENWIKSNKKLVWSRGTQDSKILTDLSFLSSFDHLESIELTHQRPLHLWPLETSWEKLKYLDLQDCAVETLISLEKLINLEELYLGYNEIIDLTKISQMRKIKILSIFGNKINTLDPIKNLSSVESLHINGNPISSLAPLAFWPKLKMLSFDQTPIADKSFLRNEENCPQGLGVNPLIQALCHKES